MNLSLDSWIPALVADGRRELFSLQDLFSKAHELRDLCVKPHERIALMRLLIGITQASLDGPEDESDWSECKPRIQTCVRDYLVKWAPSFELFGDGVRFLQIPGLEADEAQLKPADKLDLMLASGSNSTLFDNQAGEDRTFSPARLALNLLTFQCCSPCGLITVARWNGEGTPGEGSSNHAPCTSASMVHTFLLGRNLLETIHQNLLTKELVDATYGSHRWGAPIWELPVSDIGDTEAVRNATLTYLGRMAPVSRAIRLNNEGTSIVLGNGLSYPFFPVFREPTATLIKRKDEIGLLSASTSRSLWRQLSPILIKRSSEANAEAGPLALNHAISSNDLALWTGGLITDKNKILDIVEARYSLPAEIAGEAGRDAYEKGVSYASAIEVQLMQSVKAYASFMKIGSPAYNRARQHFWTDIEQGLSDLLAFASNPDPAKALSESPWGRVVATAARDAYKRSCPHRTPRQIEAFVLGSRRLSARTFQRDQ